MTDSRDGQIYNIVAIGSQCWLAQNLNYGKFEKIAIGQDSAGTQKYCYNDSAQNCDKYGGLYEWQEMMDGISKYNTSAIPSSCNGTPPTPDSNVECSPVLQGICPSGWHVPSFFEWVLLERNVGSCPTCFPYDADTTAVGLHRGIDEGANLLYGGSTCFGALLAGRSVNGGSVSGFFNLGGTGGIAAFWSTTYYLMGLSTPPQNQYAWSPIIAPSWYPRQIYQIGSSCYDKAFGYSVRCVKD